MPSIATPDELRVALLALFSVAASVPAAICAQVVDDASAAAVEFDSALMGVDAEGASRARLGGVRVLNSLCGACRACARGRGGYVPRLTTRPALMTADRNSRAEPRRG